MALWSQIEYKFVCSEKLTFVMYIIPKHHRSVYTHSNFANSNYRTIILLRLRLTNF